MALAGAASDESANIQWHNQQKSEPAEDQLTRGIRCVRRPEALSATTPLGRAHLA
ncbi:hypothetical protein CyaNS01_00564 [Cyanobium sp. NS01]|nr:hypothetical protein CyaNS01_00564 [Cyanobium sp. NS01]